jgi:DNA-binding NarL/FixJ family response regulator
MKFLVVDDHELICEAMRAALAELDAEAAILEASDSRKAMRLIELRQSHPATSVVVMSARQDHDSVMKALNQGALGFIPKSATRKVILGVYTPPQALSAHQEASSAAAPAVGPTESGRSQVSPSDLGLTERQADVLTLIMQGKSNKESAGCSTFRSRP